MRLGGIVISIFIDAETELEVELPPAPHASPATVKVSTKALKSGATFRLKQFIGHQGNRTVPRGAGWLKVLSHTKPRKTSFRDQVDQEVKGVSVFELSVLPS